jgi:hypothetical protein
LAVDGAVDPVTTGAVAGIGNAVLPPPPHAARTVTASVAAAGTMRR